MSIVIKHWILHVEHYCKKKKKEQPFLFFRLLWRVNSHSTHVLCKSLSAKWLQTSEEVENEEAIAGRDVGSGLAQELRKRCLLTELCFLCDNWPKHVASITHIKTKKNTHILPLFGSWCIKHSGAVRLYKSFFNQNWGLIGLKCRSSVIRINTLDAICSQRKIYYAQKLNAGMIFDRVGWR